MRQLNEHAANRFTGVWQTAKVANMIKSDVILGSPSARCNGVGICRVMGVGENPDCPCPRISATIGVNVDGTVRFAFDKSALTQAQFQQHFQWGIFQVTEPYRMSARMCNRIGWKSGWIQAGVYKIWESNNQLIVDFAPPLTCNA
jgi:hypothetical protein